MYFPLITQIIINKNKITLTIFAVKKKLKNKFISIIKDCIFVTTKFPHNKNEKKYRTY